MTEGIWDRATRAWIEGGDEGFERWYASLTDKERQEFDHAAQRLVEALTATSVTAQEAASRFEAPGGAIRDAAEVL